MKFFLACIRISLGDQSGISAVLNGSNCVCPCKFTTEGGGGGGGGGGASDLPQQTCFAVSTYLHVLCHTN